jgi:glutamate/tyrosine decarboxylase-like PLP-dependent enzyme
MIDQPAIAKSRAHAIVAAMTDADTTGDLLAEAARRAGDYLRALPDRPAGADPGAVQRLVGALDRPLPDMPEPAEDILDFLDRQGGPATVACAGGRYFGFVTGGSLPAALAANVLAAAWDQNAASSVTSPAAAAFDAAALRWIGQALDLPAGAGGALTTGATMAHFTALAAARNRVLALAGWDVDADGLFGAPPITVYVGAQAHASLYKVLSMLGLGRDRVVVLPVDDQGAVVARDLPPIAGPAILCLQAGNVNSGAFDDAGGLTDWAHAGGAWVHVDGAFGIWARAVPSLAGLAAGYGNADSWAFDAHKWLNVPYDSGVAMVRDPAALSAAMSISGAYLMPGDQRDAMNFGPECSRRARGIEVWAALAALGRSGLAALIERNCAQARRMAQGLRDAGVEILNDVVLNQVVAVFGDDARTERVIGRVQRDGTCWCGATLWRGRRAMRISFSSWATTDADVEISLAAIIAAAAENAGPG